MSKLYVVATPIGNLGDVTHRALDTLREVDLILCEDTRVTRKLLEKYKISTPTLSFHAHSGISKIEKILGLLKEGKNLALVSDSGTPGISDPGVQLVSKVKAYFGHGVNVIAVPGPSALTAALSVSGISSRAFTFLGFLPHKKGREKIFKDIADAKRTTVFYESPHRILKTLITLEKLCPRKQVALARELTKIYEEVIAGSPDEVLKYLESNPEKQRGEFVVIVS